MAAVESQRLLGKGVARSWGPFRERLEGRGRLRFGNIATGARGGEDSSKGGFIR
jgi:hypothetical protein